MADMQEKAVRAAMQMGKQDAALTALAAEALNITLLPSPPGNSFIAQQERYLKTQAESILQQLVAQLRTGDLDFRKAALGLGRIAGYYDLMADLHRQRRQQEEQAKELGGI